MVAALLASIVALLTVGISSATTSISPLSPYLWFVGGALSYWLGPRVKQIVGTTVSATEPRDPVDVDKVGAFFRSPGTGIA